MQAALLVLALLSPAAAAASAETDVADFLAKAKAVSNLGDAAADSPELAAMKAEIRRITLAYRADLAAQARAGTPPHSCPPERAGLTSSNLMAELNSVPPEKRRETSVTQAFYAMMKKRYPCP